MSDDSRKKNRPDFSGRTDTASAEGYGYGREPWGGAENAPADSPSADAPGAAPDTGSGAAGQSADGSPQYAPQYGPWFTPYGPVQPPCCPLPGQYYGPQPYFRGQPFPQYPSGFSPAAFDPYGFSGMPGGPYRQYAPQYAAPPQQEPAGNTPPETPCDPELLERRYAQAMELCGDLMQGRTDPAKIMDFITSSGSHFWKGAAVGAVVAFLVTNENVREAIGGALSGIFGKNNEPAE